MTPDILNPGKRSILRANLLVLVSLAVALWLADFPENRPNLLIAIPLLTATLGTADTIRCMRPSWSWYHGGVILCVYMDLMVLCMILFSLLYPYSHWLSGSHSLLR